MTAMGCPRATAALMGHSLMTHNDINGAWTDREAIEDVLERTKAVGARQRAEAGFAVSSEESR